MLDHRLDVVAANSPWTRVWGSLADHEPRRRHALTILATTPTPGLLTLVARQFRMAADLHAGDPRIAEIGALLRADHPELDPLWNCRAVGAFGAPTIDLAGQPATAHLLHPAGQPGVIILVAAPRS